MMTSTIQFDGRLLERGFWLYVWLIDAGDRTAMYVGRTGDSSSPNAASPFSRVGQHLSLKENAKGNALVRQLRKADIDPTSCTFTLNAFGPIFPEQDTMEEHEPFRDRMASLEAALAAHLRRRGYTVLGTHHGNAVDDRDQSTWRQIRESVDTDFPMAGTP